MLSSDHNEPVQLFHKTFPNFLTEQTRCTDLQFYVSPNYHVKLFMCCLRIIGKPLENMPPLPDCDLIYGEWDLPTIETRNISGALQYACRSWHKYLFAIENPTPDVLSALLDFLDKNFVFWLVLLKSFGLYSNGGAVGTTVMWLEKVWLNRQLTVAWFSMLT